MQVVEQAIVTSALAEEDVIVVAASGGIDSMVLLQALANLPQYTIIAAHAEHGLRCEQSLADASFVRAYCEERDICYYEKNLQIRNVLALEGGNTQDVCRRERYNFLKEVMINTKATKLVTAHHADDQLENLLMAMIKNMTSTTMQGIAQEREINGMHIVRPFLQITKKQLHAYAQKHAIPYREDASNDSDSYLRNRIRHYVVPKLYEENTKIIPNITQFTTRLSEDEAYMMQQAKSIYERAVTPRNGKPYRLTISIVKKEPLALQRRVVLLLLNYLYEHRAVAKSQALLDAITKFIQQAQGNSQLSLPANIVAYRAYDTVYFTQHITLHNDKQTSLQLDEWLYCDNNVSLYVTAATNSANMQEEVWYFDSAKLPLPLTLRRRQQGDRIQLAGMAAKKRLSRIFIDEKIPLHERDQLPILVSGNEVVGIVGIRMSNYFSKVRRTTDDMLLCIRANSENCEEESGMIQQDIERILITEEQIQERINELGASLTEEYKSTYPLAIGVLKGAIPFMADLIKRMDTYIELDFMDVTSYGNATVSSGEVKILKDLNTSVEGRDIIIIEDIIDSGLTLSYLVDLFKYRKAKSIKIVTLLDKPSGRKVNLKADVVGFEVPDGFVVGYGLDYAEKYRNLPYIGILKKEVYSF